jgi:hypothetical protein
MSEIAILHQLPDIAHNPGVTDSNTDLPRTLADAEQKFRTFLVSQNYPDRICWLMPGDVMMDRKRHHWIRKRRVKAAKNAAQRYSNGVERKLGIHLRAICATKDETFASVFIPEDDLDRQYHLMGHELKLSCPVERQCTSAISNPVQWLVLWCRHGRRSKMLEVNQKPGNF